MRSLAHVCCGPTWASKRSSWARPTRGTKREVSTVSSSCSSPTRLLKGGKMKQRYRVSFLTTVVFVLTAAQASLTCYKETRKEEKVQGQLLYCIYLSAA